MDKKEFLRLLFKPHITNIILSIVLAFLVLFYSPFIISLLLGYGTLLLLIFILFFYILGNITARFFKSLFNNNKILLIIVIVAFIFLFGLDDPIVNSIINRPDSKKCGFDSDCTIRFIGGGDYGCPDDICANKDWKHYQSAIKNVFATSCLSIPQACLCENSRCSSIYLEENTNRDVCRRIMDENEKNYCYYNLIRNSKDTEFCDLLSEAKDLQHDSRFIEKFKNKCFKFNK